jgi:hypothetical protein
MPPVLTSWLPLTVKFYEFNHFERERNSATWTYNAIAGCGLDFQLSHTNRVVLVEQVSTALANVRVFWWNRHLLNEELKKKKRN